MSKKKKTIEAEEEFDEDVEFETYMKPEVGIIEEEAQPKWVVDADLTQTQLKEAYKMLEKGIKIRKVALYLGIHRSKIKPVK
jgi:hypothetical protein